MSDPSPTPRSPSWLIPAMAVMMGLQLVLSWLQGSQIHRQRQELVALREDVQALADLLDQGEWDEEEGEQDVAPAWGTTAGRAPMLRARMVQASPPSDEERAQEELQASRDSARKAVSEARSVQSQLSLEENARKAEEKARLEEAGDTWRPWLWAALGVGLAAVVVRSWLRRRG